MTFLLSKNFKLTAFFLDRQRLQKQRVEAASIIKLLSNEDQKSKAWKNHTIVRSWKYFIFNKSGYDVNDIYLQFSIKAIKYYMNCIVKEYERRKIGKNNYEIWEIKCNECDGLIVKDLEENDFKILKCDKCNNKFKLYLPWWTCWGPFIQSNIAMLIRKKPTYYTKISKILNFDKRYLNKGYIWPCNITNKINVSGKFSPIPKELIKPIYCCAILKSGKRVGKTCNNIVREKCKDKCKVHGRINKIKI